jgi:hypothetical protein
MSNSVDLQFDRAEFPEVAAETACFAAFVCAVPFLAGLQNFVGIVIIGIGLYEAWKLNRRIPLTIRGPHAINRTPSLSV